MCLYYTQTQRCPSCKKTLRQSTALYDSCDRESCPCVFCSSTTKSVKSSRHTSEDEAGPSPTAEANICTIECPKAELVHGWPQLASQPCGFCRWQRSLEVRRQWHGVHFCMNPSSSRNETTVSNSPTMSSKATKHGEKDASPNVSPEAVSDMSEGGYSQQGDSVSSSSPKEGGQRKKSVRFQEPLKVEKKRSSILARFRTKSA
ncbi:hypothetical protein PG985_011145 [Apiospora marii]|uniref:uncharacterized protein n=1 Tax=Apiospora marii TaxID=335849 RepID=UPI00313022A9